MFANENLKTRKEMVKMHDEYLKRLDEAINNNRYIEASWLCYAIIEQRVSRLILKNLKNCKKNKRTKDNTASIKVRLNCIINLIKKNYNNLGQLDIELFQKIKKWCELRNDLTHDLVSLDKYKCYDDEFKKLASDGYNLIKELYKESSKYRNLWYHADGCLEAFPESCKSKQQCIYLEK